jgi:hypothetical protein
MFSILSWSSSMFSTMVVLQSTTSNLRFALTNVYGPADHARTDLFLADLLDVAANVAVPWMLIGDFNITRCPADKNTASINSSIASRFSQTIDTLELIELRLLDRLFTWTNKWAEPTLARLDRAFISTVSYLRPPTYLRPYASHCLHPNRHP